jgi:hypothetical protein
MRASIAAITTIALVSARRAQWRGLRAPVLGLAVVVARWYLSHIAIIDLLHRLIASRNPRRPHRHRASKLLAACRADMQN